MSVFNLDGSFNFVSQWGVPDLKSVVDTNANTITLQPNFNTYADNPDDPFWVDQATGEGAKNMEASTFIEPGDMFNGEDLTFTGTVQSNTLDAEYTAQFFIKALDPNDGFADALGGSLTFDLPLEGNFSAMATADQLAPGLLIQCGFVITGRNANPDDEVELGSIVVSEVVSSSNKLFNSDIEVSVFPNPAVDMLNIESATPVQSFRIMNMMGQEVFSGRANSNNVNVSGLAAGTYSIIAEVEEGMKALTFVKK